ncbi:MAG TPA: mannose-1-phosphate guanylyltransferase [Caldilineaceae bacterium]|nr:mannose-1-phosphate guanylyltransferase [Caldilineaceae bacterium]
MYAVILAGGGGTRLWPRSRQSQPKQFVDITGTGRTLIQATADRLSGLIDTGSIYVVTGAQFAEMTHTQLPELSDHQILVEPSGRNSAPAIGLACVHLAQRDPQAVAAFLPADHVIPDSTAFTSAVREAARVAQGGYLVTLGVTPTFPHTGYGYIKRQGDALDNSGSLPVYRVERFLEKPNRTTAEYFLNEGGYYWNAGIFICRVDCMLAEIERQLPEVYQRLQQIQVALNTSQAAAVLEQVWATMPNISIDYGVMERAERVAVAPLDAGWNDVGSWDALQAVLAQDMQNNVIVKGETLAIGSEGNIVYSDKYFVALIDVNDLVVVETDNALLIGHKTKMQRVREVVEELRNQGRTDLL